MIRHLIFDVDGTLIDSKVDIADAQLWVLRQLGIDRWSREDIYPRIGRPLTETFKELLPPELHDRITEAKRMYIAHYRPRALDTTTLFPGVEETLAMLHARRTPMAVATTKSSVTANRVLQHFGIRQYFVQVQGTDDTPAKPDPYVVNRILREQNWTAETTALVGDSEVDILCAHKAGIQAWAVTWGSTPEARAIELGADRIVRSMIELLEEKQERR
ncbi:MAG: HAD-IA family hydrolase [Bacteroidetes bacterium]|nr:HAD-IA family hydrolase [Bacteroidota bacterium]